MKDSMQCLIILLLGVEALGSGADIYVSAKRGSDTAGNGTFAHPFASLQKAQSAARHLVTVGGTTDILVTLEAGRYIVDDPLRFTALDAPTAAFHTTYRGPNPSEGEAMLVGGVTVPSNIWQPSGREHIWKANVIDILPSYSPAPLSKTSIYTNPDYPSIPLPDGPTHARAVRPFFNLLEAGKGATLARIPKSGSGYLSGEGCHVNTDGLKCPAGVLPSSKELADDIQDIQVVCHTGSDWDGETRPALGVQNTQMLEPTTQKSSQAQLLQFLQPERTCGGPCNDKSYVQGSSLFITEPGEWALDSRNGVLYLWPSDEEAMRRGEVDVVAMTTRRILDVRGESFHEPASRLNFEQLTFVGSDFDNMFLCDFWTRTPVPWREGMVYIENATDVGLLSSSFRDAGHSAIWIEGFAQHISVRDSWIERAGKHGISINGPDPGATANGLWRSASDSYVNFGHTITNNVIFDVGIRVAHGAGVWIYDAGDISITHNVIREGLRDGVGVYGAPTVPDPFPENPHQFYGKQTDFWYGLSQAPSRNIEVAYNDVSNVVRDSSDSGGLEYAYVGVNNSAHTNCFHDLDQGNLDGSYMNFLFQDDGSHFVNFSSNLLFNLRGHGLADAGMIKSINCSWENNVIADSTLGALFNMVPYTQPAANMHFNRNIFASVNASSDHDYVDYTIDEHTIATLAKGGSWVDGPYAEMWGFTNHTSPSLKDPVVASWDYNLFFDVNHWPTQVAKFGWDTHAQLEDPRFVNAGTSSTTPSWKRTCMDYALRDDSPAWPMGFNRIELERVGLTSSYPFDTASLGEVNAVLNKVQAERYQRMHGLWRLGGFGIAPGFGFDPRGAWARYDSVDVDCKAPCQLVLRMSTVRGTHVRLALGEPVGSAVIASSDVKTTTLSLVQVPLVTSLSVLRGTFFLMLDGECSVDWFKFVSTATHTLGGLMV